MYLCNKANKANVPISMNLAAYNQILDEKNRKNLLSMINRVSIIFANYEEGRALTNKDEPISIVKELANYVDMAILTLGKEGCIVTNGHKIFREKLAVARTIDTTGAGDAFVGVFLAKHIKGSTLKDCIKSATFVSTLVTQQIGATSQIKMLK
jgi:sugar/nucleoside kinase (ribokinase family)